MTLRARIFKDKAGEWRFTILARNGEPIATSEGYANRADAERTARLLEADLEYPDGDPELEP